MRVKSLLREWSYRCGLLGALHAWRNRQHLTVLMFHRVLPADGPAYATAEREFTFTESGFGRTLDFIARHYTPVTLQQVHEALVDGRSTLPPCPVLITFDDGWRDTLTQAAPMLAQRRMPAVLFLATEVLSLSESSWWQWQLTHELNQPGGLSRWRDRLGLQQPATMPAQQATRQVTATLAAMQPAQRAAQLASAFAPEAPARQMLQPQQAQQLATTMAVAGHGRTHGPLAELPSAQDDLQRSHQALKALSLWDSVMSFPHGSWTPQVFAHAREQGFNLCFSSDPHLVDLSSGHLRARAPLGRIHVPENEWTCEGTHINPAKLATFLFFRSAQ